ncbi:hypothetical protein DEJ23_10295 [Curtobacterium sp. MCSS17_008]|uniref:hypothetical protein n=1 Tax=Curtobacterium sp. MCSS17_008 TaxID=2175647 RepID=UPI000DA96DF7|nr:hypothetical protein [Curtobacterium sp. MCSS17_008]PZF56254.1 hypothetical protein DEJ23_10295 [Curtobacterium sp. MCSS17_008]
MSGEATDLSARLWDERALLGDLVTAAQEPDRALALLDRLRVLRLEQDVLVHALAGQWGTAPDTATLRSLERVAPPPWDLLLPDHLAALATLTAELDALVPSGAVRERWDRVRGASR